MTLKGVKSMSIFRVERTKDYTVMSNYHLRDKRLTLKAKGLLSQMLSLPENWDYTLSGLSQINQESIDAIRGAIRELEDAGYIIRSRERDKKGHLRGTEYVIFEQPQQHKQALPTSENSILENPTLGKPTLDNPTLENPTLGKPTLEKPMLENPTQLIKDIQIIELQNTDSIPFPSVHSGNGKIKGPKRKGMEMITQSAVEIYRQIIKDNIGYDVLKQEIKFDGDRLDEIVDIILETICTARKSIRIAGDDYPAELVKAKFMRLNSEHIHFVFDCMGENTTKIHNIKQYLRAALFNATSTINNYYTALVAHDMASV